MISMLDVATAWVDALSVDRLHHSSVDAQLVFDEAWPFLWPKSLIALLFILIDTDVVLPTHSLKQFKEAI